MDNFLHTYITPIIFAMVLIFGVIQVQTYVIKPKRMPIEVLVFYIMFYICAGTYFLLKIILGQ